MKVEYKMNPICIHKVHRLYIKLVARNELNRAFEYPWVLLNIVVCKIIFYVCYNILSELIWIIWKLYEKQLLLS